MEEHLSLVARVGTASVGVTEASQHVGSAYEEALPVSILPRLTVPQSVMRSMRATVLSGQSLQHLFQMMPRPSAMVG